VSRDRKWTPLEVTPGEAGERGTVEGLTSYLDSIDDIGDLLTQKKALIFRGFGITEGTAMSVMDRLVPNRAAYVHGNSPRTKAGSNVYTSTEYPAEFVISMHNELSYAHHWPQRLLFFCAVAPETGGATSVVDSALWLSSLDNEILEAYRPGVRYSQNLHGGRGLGRSWQETFETDDRAEVERFLAGSGANWAWLKGGSLRVSQDRPSVLRHPVTDEEVWFNQSDQWHPAALGADAKALAQVVPADEMPQSVSFADGSPIPDSYVQQVRERGLGNAVNVDWRAGDVLIIDNVLVAHGRQPFTGPRRVLVAMSS
jgi:alpha-ketoglutarate-dependent taurine dioxygenase